VRLGLLRQTPGLRSVLELTDTGRRTLLDRTPVQMIAAAPAATAAVSATADHAYDVPLFEELRTLRKRLADERDVPAYVIFPDTTLRAMAHDMPATRTDLRRIPGVGDKKLSDYGEAFLAAIAAFRER
jgi:ATP-dependent DNA helicase RecQ